MVCNLAIQSVADVNSSQDQECSGKSPLPWEQAHAQAFLHSATLTTQTRYSLLLKSTLCNRPIPGTATAFSP